MNRNAEAGGKGKYAGEAKRLVHTRFSMDECDYGSFEEEMNIREIITTTRKRRCKLEKEQAGRKRDREPVFGSEMEEMDL